MPSKTSTRLHANFLIKGDSQFFSRDFSSRQGKKERLKNHMLFGSYRLKRNRHLVDYSNVCIAYLSESKGGTAYTVQYAYEKGIKIINIANEI